MQVGQSPFFGFIVWQPLFYHAGFQRRWNENNSGFPINHFGKARGEAVFPAGVRFDTAGVVGGGQCQLPGTPPQKPTKTQPSPSSQTPQQPLPYLPPLPTQIHRADGQPVALKLVIMPKLAACCCIEQNALGGGAVRVGRWFYLVLQIGKQLAQMLPPKFFRAVVMGEHVLVILGIHDDFPGGGTDGDVRLHFGKQDEGGAVAGRELPADVVPGDAVFLGGQFHSVEISNELLEEPAHLVIVLQEVLEFVFA